MKLIREGKRGDTELAHHTVIASGANRHNSIPTFYILGTDKTPIRIEVSVAELKRMIAESGVSITDEPTEAMIEAGEAAIVQVLESWSTAGMGAKAVFKAMQAARTPTDGPKEE